VEEINQNNVERQSSNLLYEERIKRSEIFYWKKRWLGVIVLYGIMKDREKVNKG